MNYLTFIQNAEEFLTMTGWHYLYGYKGETITKALNEALTKEYPRIWGQSNYRTKSAEWLGQKAVDCSGLIYLASDKNPRCLIGSSQMATKWQRISTPRPGCIGWRSGHVVIVKEVKGTEIVIIESAGIESGIRERVAQVKEFAKYLLCPVVDYAEYGNNYQVGWNKDSKGWWFSPDGKTYHKGGYFKCAWSKNPVGDWFYFDLNGYCVITNTFGVVKSPTL